jgi:hypothetical protein
MKTQCLCGFDCLEFISQHAIPSNAHLACPNCEALLNLAGEQTTSGSGQSFGTASAPVRGMRCSS